MANRWQNKPNNAVSSFLFVDGETLQRGWYSLSCKEKTQMSSAQMTRTEQPPQLEGERNSTLAKVVLDGATCQPMTTLDFVIQPARGASSHALYPFSLQLLFFCLFPSSSPPGLPFCCTEDQSWCALIFWLFQHQGRQGQPQTEARLSFIFRGQASDILLISLSLRGMRHALIEWDTALIFARDWTISSQDRSSGWPKGF